MPKADADELEMAMKKITVSEHVNLRDEVFYVLENTDYYGYSDDEDDEAFKRKRKRLSVIEDGAEIMSVSAVSIDMDHPSEDARVVLELLIDEKKHVVFKSDTCVVVNTYVIHLY